MQLLQDWLRYYLIFWEMKNFNGWSNGLLLSGTEIRPKDFLGKIAKYSIPNEIYGSNYPFLSAIPNQENTLESWNNKISIFDTNNILPDECRILIENIDSKFFDKITIYFKYLQSAKNQILFSK